jgi:DNA-binding NarL/FixJ family response regulator
MEPQAILLIEQRLLIANQLALILRGRGYRCLIVRSSLPAGLRLAAEEQVRVLVLPANDGAEAMRHTAYRIAEETPETRMVFTSNVADPRLMRQASLLGAGGFVAGDRSGRSLLAAIDQTLEGGPFFGHCPKQVERPSQYRLLLDWPSILPGHGTPVP